MQYRPSMPPGWRFPQSPTYPPVDTTQFSHSVGESMTLLQQAGTLLAQLNDKDYATKIMEQAQAGKQETVDQMIHSIDGLHMPIQTEYTPTGVKFRLALPTNDNEQATCCHMEISLKWGQ